MSNPVWELIESTLRQYIGNARQITSKKAEFAAAIAEPARNQLDAILTDHRLSYRDATLIQLAFALKAPGLDTTQRPEGARSLGGRLGDFLSQNHIHAVADAYQNVGKNSATLARGNVPHFDAFLRWAAQAGPAELSMCFEYTCARVAELARPVSPMPELNVAKLTFAEVMGLYDALLQAGSHGAYEQYIVASLLDTLVQQTATPGYRVETKALTASDRSAGTAADIQVWAGATLVEAYEVTANDWRSKLIGVSQKMKEHDLARIHIVAPLTALTHGEVARELAETLEDISVLDLQGFAASIVSALRRARRSDALIRLYECLDRYAGVEWVNRYVELLISRNITHTVP